MWMMFGGGGKKIDLRVRDNTPKVEQAARDPESVTAQAIAEVRGATATPGACCERLSGDEGQQKRQRGARTIVVPTTPVTVPTDGVSSPRRKRE